MSVASDNFPQFPDMLRFLRFPLVAAVLCIAVAGFLIILTRSAPAAPAKFLVAQPGEGFELPEIVFPEDSGNEESFDYGKLSKTSQVQDHYTQINPALEAVRYFREAIQRMTGKSLPVVRRSDKSRGIVLTTLCAAPPDIQNDPTIQSALRNTGEDDYNANEAFFIRTEPDRILIVTNTEEGFNHAVVELLESVGYEVLGMGPHWTHVPDFHAKPLTFSLETSGRPGFYIRQLGLTSGQGHGIGTLFGQTLPDVHDETVTVSYNRWSIGTHIAGRSMPLFLGHKMQNYHQAVFEKRKEINSTAGFLQAPDSEILVQDGAIQVKENGTPRSVKLDLSVPFVRQIILEDFKKQSEAHFAEKRSHPLDRVFVFGTDPEDGVQPIEYLSDPNWYPDYLKEEGIPLGQPYVLDGFKGLDQPKEIWDPASLSDTIFGFNNWLLREYDKWIDSLPSTDQVTADGESKKDAVRTSLLSYNNHDIPPNFNLDPRIRVMIAGFPKHRGTGKWKRFASQSDMAAAFHLLLPREPAGDYLIPSQSYYWDYDMTGIHGSRLAETVQPRISREYEAGFRAISMESDLNFGKMGLEYYLYAKMFWNPHLSPAELEALQERWFQRSFGSGWKEMREYYQLLAPENRAAKAPNTWAQAIQLIVAADQKIDPLREPEAQNRLDDLKQFWYFYYLVASGQTNPPSPALREFLWKGQMSYMTAMHMVAGRYFKSSKVREIVGQEIRTGSAHYTPEETAAWWKAVTEFWPLIPVTRFDDATLANGRRGQTIDTNDLVAVKEFGEQNGKNASLYFNYNSDSIQFTTFLSAASSPGDLLGCRIVWSDDPADEVQKEKSIPYGISRWDSRSESWHSLVDETMTSSDTRRVQGGDGRSWHVAEIRFAAPEPGTYRISADFCGPTGWLSPLNLGTGAASHKVAGNTARGFTFFQAMRGPSQSSTYFYIPKGIRSLDLEIWGPSDLKNTLVLHNGLPSNGMKGTRSIDLTKKGTHHIELASGEDGSLAEIQSNGLCFPYLYSIPLLWAKSPSDLLVPRGIAEADGLTISQ